jgi:hypothetical protein
LTQAHRLPQGPARPAGLKGGHLTRGTVDLALGKHRAGGVVHRGEQVELAAVWSAAGAAGKRGALLLPAPLRTLLRLFASEDGRIGLECFINRTTAES